jgi:hypothetical protein
MQISSFVTARECESWKSRCAKRQVQHETRRLKMSTTDEERDDGPRLPKVTVAGVEINIDRLDDERGTVWLFDKTGRRLAEILDVSKITISTTWDDVCAAE